MILFNDSTGQLANQLFEFSTFIVKAKSDHSIIINLYFDNYKYFFEGSSTNKRGLLLTSGNKFIDHLLRKFISYLARYLPKLIINTKDISNLNTKNSLCIKSGSWYTNFEEFYKEQDFIRAYFKPIPELSQQINNFVLGFKQQDSVLVGVHLRRGDYKTFQNGKYYFDDYIFIDYLRQIKKLHFPMKVNYLLCSNEPIKINNYSEFTTFQTNGHPVVDLYCLAECDFIIGPPSTFTMWASFYGQTPLFKIRTASYPLSLDDFKLDYGY